MDPRTVDLTEEECEEHDFYNWDELMEECVDPSVCDIEAPV